MRTTVTIDSDTRDLLERDMRERGVPFKRALNDAIRSALVSGTRGVLPPTQPRALGAPRLAIDHVLRTVGEDEDTELIRRLERGR